MKAAKIKLECSNPACSEIFSRKKSAISPNNFCSRSCSASVNNARFPKHPGLRKICGFCQKVFVSRKKYCSPECKIKDQTITEKELIQKIKTFYEDMGRIPLRREFIYTTSSRRRFGSWNKAIEAAGLVPNPVMFAKKYTAKDGHKCDSLAEKIIDDWLFARKIEHERSIPYPGNSKLTVDFRIKDYWIEFFGLRGQHTRYDQLREIKLQLAQQHELKFFEIYPEHLFPENKLNSVFVVLQDI